MPSVPQAVIATISAKGARSRLPQGGVLCHSMPSRFLSEPIDGDAKHGCRRSAAMPPSASGAGAWRRRSPRSPCSASASVRPAPLLPLLLEQRGTDATLNGLNAGATFIGVIIGPLLAPRCVRRFGIRNFLLVCFGLDIALFLAMKAFDSMAAWFVLRALLGLVGSSIFTTGEAWINQLAGDVGRGRIIGIYAAALSAGFGIGPLILSLTGIEGWSPFLVNAAITALAALPLFGVGDVSRSFGRERGASPLRMFARAPLILGAVAVFGLYRGGADGVAADLGRAQRADRAVAAATLSAVYFGSIVLQVLIGWLSDRVSRHGGAAAVRRGRAGGRDRCW